MDTIMFSLQRVYFQIYSTPQIRPDFILYCMLCHVIWMRRDHKSRCTILGKTYSMTAGNIINIWSAFVSPPPFFSKLHSTCNLVLGGRTPSLVSVVFIALLIFFDFALSFLFGTEHSNIIIWRMGEGVKGMQTQKNWAICLTDKKTYSSYRTINHTAVMLLKTIPRNSLHGFRVQSTDLPNAEF